MRTRSKSDRADAPHTGWRIRNSASTRIRPFALHYFTPCLTNTPFYQAGTTQLLFDFIKSSCMYMPTNILSPTCILPTCVCICICSQHILSDDHSVFWCANCFFFLISAFSVCSHISIQSQSMVILLFTCCPLSSDKSTHIICTSKRNRSCLCF